MSAYKNKTINQDLAQFNNDIIDSLTVASDHIFNGMVEIAQRELDAIVYSVPSAGERRRYGDVSPSVENRWEEQSLFNAFDKEVDIRGGGNGVFEMNIRMTYDAPWQNPSGAGMSLADAVEQGVYMHSIGSRPFLQETANQIEAEANELLIESLKQSGFIEVK